MLTTRVVMPLLINRYGISTTGWNGFYINTMAFLSPEYAWEHPYVDWYLAPKGAAFVPTPLPARI